MANEKDRLMKMREEDVVNIPDTLLVQQLHDALRHIEQSVDLGQIHALAFANIAPLLFACLCANGALAKRTRGRDTAAAT